MTTAIYTNISLQDLSKPPDETLDRDANNQLQLVLENEIVLLPKATKSSKTHPKRKCLSQNHKGLAFIAFLVFVISGLIIMVYFYVKKSAEEESPINSFPLKDFQESDFCSRKINFVETINRKATANWTVVTTVDKNWKTSSSTFRDRSFNNSTMVAFSPVYQLPGQLCGIVFSINHIKNLNCVQLLINHQTINSSLGIKSRCNRFYFYDTKMFFNKTKIQIKLKLEVQQLQDYYFSIHFQHCNKLFTIKNTPISDLHPQKINKNRCSLEYVPHINCDWMKLRSNDVTTMFQRVEETDCIKRGLVSIPEGEKWFLSMDSSSSTNATQVTSSYIISPLIERSTSHVMLSYYYQMSNNLSSINVYVSERYFDLKLLKRFSSPSSRINTPSNDWNREQIQIAVPTELDFFHIILEGELRNDVISLNESCSHHQLASLAVDEISLELMNDFCKNSLNRSGILDCHFEPEDENQTNCKWTFSGITSLFPDWTIVNDSLLDFEPIPPILPHHIKNRGFFLHFDPESRALYEKAFFRSPLVLANSNCSCIMKMVYLMRYERAPRVTIQMSFGSKQHDTGRPHTKLWSMKGFQNENWLSAEIIIPLINDGVPFQIEFRISEITYSRGNIFIDDLKFLSCDVNFYAEAEGLSFDEEQYH